MSRTVRIYGEVHTDLGSYAVQVEDSFGDEEEFDLTRFIMWVESQGLNPKGALGARSNDSGLVGQTQPAISCPTHPGSTRENQRYGGYDCGYYEVNGQRPVGDWAKDKPYFHQNSGENRWYCKWRSR